MNQAAGQSRGGSTLGLDLGTSELKALVMSANGAVLATAHAPLSWQLPQPGWAEQDPQDWWRAAVAACAQLRWSAPEAVGDNFVSLGTSGVLFSVTARHRPIVDEAVRAFCHALPGLWHQMAVMLSAAGSLTWLTRLTGHADEGELLAKSATLGTAERDSAPIFLRYLSGERTPHNNAAASGVFIGQRHAHEAPHLAWSVIEGVSFGLRDGLDAKRRAGSRVEELQLVGGGSRSTLWAQLLADVLQVRVVIGEASNVGAALGTARLAALGPGEPSAARIAEICRTPKTLHRLTPNPTAVLERRLASYRSTYQALRPVFSSFTTGSQP